MKRLYWKIVLTVGIALAGVLSASLVVMDIYRDRHEARERSEQAAALKFFEVMFQNGVAHDVSLEDLESHVEEMLHSRVRISKADREAAELEPWTPPEDENRDDRVAREVSVHFTQGGTLYVMSIFLDPDDSVDLDLGLPLLATVAVLGLLAIPLAIWVSSPLRKLRNDIKQFASGDLAHRTDVSAKDEVGDLAQAFNLMAKSIQDMIRAGKDLTANVSHELRSPLTRIDLARQFLEEQANGRQLIHLESMREEIEGMNGLIDRILQLSRLDLGPTDPQGICLAKVLRSVTSRHGTSFEVNDIQLNVDAPETLSARGVEEDIVCLLENLLSNALKFTPHGGQVDVSMKQRGETAAIRVANDADQPAVEPKRLLEAFQRGGTSESIPGSGLGLTIAKRIAENHGGGMQASWANGKFTIKVTLPLA